MAVGYQRGRAPPFRVATADLRLPHDDNGPVDESAEPVGCSTWDGDGPAHAGAGANGFEVCGLDASRSGAQHVGAEATGVGLRVALVAGTFLELPFPASSFDFVLACNVLHHGDSASTGHPIAEVARVLRPRGLYLGTMLSKRNAQYGLGREISRNTFVQDGLLGDRRHPHLYCNAAKLLALHAAFESLALEDRDQVTAGYPPSITGSS